MFQAEAEGLQALAAAGEVRVPAVIDCGIEDGEAYIAIEKLTLERGGSGHQARFGKQLAALHRHTETRFGWHRNNTIGMTPQHNPWADDWLAFFREHRLEYQLYLAECNGHGGELQQLGAALASRLPQLFRGYEPEASLLHGDLWSGNFGVADGEPVIFDPAVYYGDRESDIAMTQLFGGFGREFYDSYQAAWPMAAGHEARLRLYKLYHVLNHLNLFGSGYLGQSLSLLRSLVASTRDTAS